MSVPAVRDYVRRHHQVVAERDRLAQELEALRRVPVAVSDGTPRPPLEDWSPGKRRKAELTVAYQASAATACLLPRIASLPDAGGQTLARVAEHLVKSEPYWFQRIEVLPGLFSPGWSDPAKDKLPFYGLPEDLTGMRVLDIGCAEGFFSFEAERRGAREVIGIDHFPDSIRRFNVVKTARQSNATAVLMNVYDLDPRRLGTFDLVLFYGVFYHLKHPQLALERIRSVCTGELRFQTHIYEEPAVRGSPWAKFHPHGLMSGANKELFDPTVFWLFNGACCLAMLDHVGFVDATVISDDPQPFVVGAKVPQASPGVPPNEAEAPWC